MNESVTTVEAWVERPSSTECALLDGHAGEIIQTEVGFNTLIGTRIKPKWVFLLHRRRQALDTRLLRLIQKHTWPQNLDGASAEHYEHSPVADI